MMEHTESCVPPGFRFHPTDEELVGYYLKKKVMSQTIHLDVIRDIDLYRIEPWDLQERCRIGYEEQNEWYFFSHKDKKYPTGTRTNRATMAGFWKATGRDKAVYDQTNLIGMRKTLVFYKGRAPNGQKSDWIMHEYRLETDENGPPQEEGWVVCRAFKKKATTQTRHNKAIDQGWDSSNYYNDQADHETRLLNSTMDMPDCGRQYPPRNPPNYNDLCKQEINNITMQPSDHPFMQLPRLESHSLSLMKRPLSSISLLSDRSNNNSNDAEDLDKMKKVKSSASSFEKVKDWRALDKFVASQLSHDNEQALNPGHNQIHQGLCSSLGDIDQHNHHQGVTNKEDIALFLLENCRDEGEGKGQGDEGEKLIRGFLPSNEMARFR